MDSTKSDSEKNCEIFLNKTIQVLHEAIDSTDCLDFLRNNYYILKDNYNVPISGECSDLEDDIRFLLNIYKSDTMGFNDLNPELSPIAKIELLIVKGKMILDGKLPSELPKLYKTYTRWIDFNNEKIEVELVLDKGWDGIVYMSKINKELYLMDLTWMNGGYDTRLRKFSNSEYEELKTKHNTRYSQ